TRRRTGPSEMSSGNAPSTRASRTACRKVPVKLARSPLQDIGPGTYLASGRTGQPAVASRSTSRRTPIMRRTSPFLVLSLVALLVTCAALFVVNRRGAEALRAAREAEQTTRVHYGQAIDAIAAIQDSLNAISLAETGVMRPLPLSDERRLSPDR